MEEICHLILGHQPSKLNYAETGHGSASDSTVGRTYHHQTEEEAYAIGAATLVPFKPLRDLLQSGLDVKTIADRFDVSVQLVNYRIRVAGLQGDSFSG
jgi:Zn-dependent peptidase ImmA (M78 family)